MKKGLEQGFKARYAIDFVKKCQYLFIYQA